MADTTPYFQAEDILAAAHPLHGLSADFDPLLERIGERPIVLLGEATHGTHEFYAARAHLTQRLVEERGFNAVAVEADWPDAYRVNRFVRGFGDERRPMDALRDFTRFPTWMWRNAEVLALVEWLHTHNRSLAPGQRVGFYGLDLYSLYTSLEAAVAYLDRVDPDAAARARERYSCFDHATDDAVTYGQEVMIGTRPSCQDEAVAQLVEIQRLASEALRRDGLVAADEQFFAEQNARVVANAEAYYRGMFGWRVNTWNLRDRHMTDTLMALENHLRRTVGTAKIVVWAHNSHLGDARATEMTTREELNVGQLVRQRYGDDAVLVGFTTHTGTVSAASQWGGPVERKRVRPALADSYEALFHQTREEAFLLLLDEPTLALALSEPRLERAIGVIYRPATERASHYFQARLTDQFDAVVHYDQSRAVQPLETTPLWERGELPETYPFGV